MSDRIEEIIVGALRAKAQGKKPDSPAIAEQRRRLRESIAELHSMSEGDAPDFILVLQASLIVRRLLVIAPKQMSEELLRPLIEKERTSHGLCAHCDTEIPPALSHAPQCASCDERDAREAAEIDAELERSGDPA